MAPADWLAIDHVLAVDHCHRGSTRPALAVRPVFCGPLFVMGDQVVQDMFRLSMPLRRDALAI
ncbi:hypothetical protein [Brevundimonas vesicularis]|jgi:hypothetical protein|uniref:hypothetical protein n=1 Tax=Brevundimonas vesicularis TaxID=41276 RepID=UPI0038D38CA2